MGDSTVAANLEGVEAVCTALDLVGEVVGVVYLGVDGDAGEPGRRKGELRGEP